MALYLKLLLVAIILVIIVMGVYGLKFLYDKGASFNVNADPEKYKKMKQDGIYSVYKEENKREQEKSKDT
jgi:hypothetical protein